MVDLAEILKWLYLHHHHSCKKHVFNSNDNNKTFFWFLKVIKPVIDNCNSICNAENIIPHYQSSLINKIKLEIA